MTPFEDLIRELSVIMGIDLVLNAQQSCTLSFFPEELTLQIDLDTNGDKILIGTQLGRITPGSYRDRLFKQALKSNGMAKSPQGVFAFSEKNDTLVFFQFLDFPLSGEKLYHILQNLRKTATFWKEAILLGQIPDVLSEKAMEGSQIEFR